jgi:hypothetical protein
MPSPLINMSYVRQTERSDMLETIRQLSRTVKLKDLIIANFIPEEYAKGIERRSVWNDSDDCWTVQVRQIGSSPKCYDVAFYSASR